MKGRINYEPNSLGGGCPMQSPDKMRAFITHAQQVDGRKVRERSATFSDHYSQATLFWNSQSDIEKQHIVEAAHFELGKVEDMSIRERMVQHFKKIDNDLAVRVAKGIGVPPPNPGGPNHGRTSAALSMERSTRRTVKGRKVAVLAPDGANIKEITALKEFLKAEGVDCKILSMYAGTIRGEGGSIQVDKMFVTTASVLFDAVYVPGGKNMGQALAQQGYAKHFVNEAFLHCKPVAATGEGVDLLRECSLPGVRLAKESQDAVVMDQGVVTAISGSMKDFALQFLESLRQHRHWDRDQKSLVPA
jgi:catalase